MVSGLDEPYGGSHVKVVSASRLCKKLGIPAFYGYIAQSVIAHGRLGRLLKAAIKTGGTQSSAPMIEPFKETAARGKPDSFGTGLIDQRRSCGKKGESFSRTVQIGQRYGGSLSSAFG
jgi:hypothetical protein